MNIYKVPYQPLLRLSVPLLHGPITVNRLVDCDIERLTNMSRFLLRHIM